MNDALPCPFCKTSIDVRALPPDGAVDCPVCLHEFRLTGGRLRSREEAIAVPAPTSPQNDSPGYAARPAASTSPPAKESTTRTRRPGIEKPIRRPRRWGVWLVAGGFGFVGILALIAMATTGYFDSFPDNRPTQLVEYDAPAGIVGMPDHQIDRELRNHFDQWAAELLRMGNEEFVRQIDFRRFLDEVANQGIATRERLAQPDVRRDLNLSFTDLRGDAAALADAEILGLDLFRRDARCMNCHHGPTFSDGRFHDLGLSFYGRRTEDLGRHAVTGAEADRGRFRTPGLRDVTHTTPLMHNGMFELSGVLNMYNAGMVTLKRQPYQRDDPAFPVKSPHLKPLGLNRQDLADLAAFLGALEEPRQRVLPPPLPAIEGEPVTATRQPPGR